jgi:hypothetical protein
MKIKENLQEVQTSDFWYDLSKGGYLDPEKLCENEEDAKKVREAIKVVEEYEESLEEQIEDFLL